MTPSMLLIRALSIVVAGPGGSNDKNQFWLAGRPVFIPAFFQYIRDLQGWCGTDVWHLLVPREFGLR